MREAVLVIVLVLVFGCGTEEANESPDPTPATRCEQLRMHLVDLRLAGVESIDKEAHRRVHVDAMGNDFLTACGAMPDATITCALEAPDSVSAAACNSGANQ